MHRAPGLLILGALIFIALPLFAEEVRYDYFFSASCPECVELHDELRDAFGPGFGLHDIDQEEELALLFAILEERNLGITAFPVLLTPEGAVNGFEAIRKYLESAASRAGGRADQT